MIGHWINGEERASAGGRTFDAIDPWLQAPHSSVALGDAADADAALTAARRAFDDGPWPRASVAERASVLHRLADLLLVHADELASADCSDMGKPLADAVERDVPRAAQNVRFFADHARLSTAEAYPMPTGHHAFCRYEPAGVVVAIAPWNFPLMLETWKVAPALAWGNTVVLKPAEQSPSSATRLAQLATAAGLPDGVLNVVQGVGEEVGAVLTVDPRADRVTFTGSSATGRTVAAAAAANLAPVSLELGGKSANVIMADCDLDVAVEWSVRAIFGNAGQVCLAGSRVFVQRPVYDEFVARFVAAADQLRLGDPRDPATSIGPLANEAHHRKVTGYFQDLPAGAKVLCGGPAGDGTWFVRPTVLVDVPPDARVCTEEVFGPVAVVTPFDAEGEAVTLANATRYGLNAMVFTEHLRTAHRLAGRLRAGTVWVNCFNVRDMRAPFGGVGDSGIGREGGTFSREFFTEPKAVVVEP